MSTHHQDETGNERSGVVAANGWDDTLRNDDGNSIGVSLLIAIHGDDGVFPMRIRPFRNEDLPTLKAIMVAAFDGVSIDQGAERLFGEINGHDWRWRKARHLDDDLVRDPRGIFVAEEEEEGRVLGFVSTWLDREAGIGHIPNISLASDARGKGLGRQLLEFALAHFRDQQMTHAKIETLVQNEVGQHLYTSLGFREVARQIHFVAALNSPSQEVSCESR